MKQKLLFLLTALCFGVITGVKAEDAYFGSSTKVCGAWDASSKSKNYILQKQGSITVYFTISTNTDTQNYPTWQKWYTWLIDVSCNGWQFAFRADNEPGSNWHGTLTPEISYSDNFAEMYTRDNMDGANVELTLSRDVKNTVTVLATTTKGSNTWWKQEIITLGDGAGDHDLTFYLTGDNCYGEIHSVIGDCVGTTENETSWWNNFSDYYSIEANKTLTLNFQNFSSKVKNWNNFITVITNDKNRGETGYAEEVVLRTDDYGWGTYYDHAKFSNNYNWDTYTNDLDGADVELKVRRLGTKTAVKATYTTTSGKKYYQQYVYTSPSGTDAIRVFLTVDQSHITNLTSSIADTPDGASEYLYSVKAVDGSDTELKTFATGSYWTGEDGVTVVYPYAISYGGSWYTTSEANYGVTVNASNTNVAIEYTKDASIVGFYEGESVVGTDATYSNGAYGTVAAQNKRDRGISAGSLTPGKYQFVARLVSDGHTRSITLREGTNDPMASLTANNKTGIASTDFIVAETTGSLYINGANSGTEKTNLSTSFDYVIIRKTAVTGTIASSGYSSLATPYGLDFANATGLTAAYAVSNISKTAVTLTSVNELPANSGVILKGTPGATYSIPVKADASYDGTNLLHAAVTAYGCAANEVYILQGGLFHLVTAASTVPAGKAYLLAADVPNEARSLIISDEEDPTAINAIEAAESEAGALKDGKYLINGKIIIVKNGVKYSANGQILK